MKPHLLFGNFAKIMDQPVKLVTIETDQGDKLPKESDNFEVYDYATTTKSTINGSHLTAPTNDEIKQFIILNIDKIYEKLTELYTRGDANKLGGKKKYGGTKKRNKNKNKKNKKRQHTIKTKNTTKNKSIKKHLKNKSR
jgi:hypothetical protein